MTSTHWSTAGVRRHLRRAVSGLCSPATCHCCISRSDRSSSNSRYEECSIHCKYSDRPEPVRIKENKFEIKFALLIETTFLVLHKENKRTNYKFHQKYISTQESIFSKVPRFVLQQRRFH